jgi:anti-anti-sigma regulatory factor
MTGQREKYKPRMPEQTKILPTERFSFGGDDRKEYARIALHTSFSLEDWESLQKVYETLLARGATEFDLDLKGMSIISSQLLGLLTGFNSDVKSKGGKLRVLVTKGSHLDHLLHLSMLDRIIKIKTV